MSREKQLWSACKKLDMTLEDLAFGMLEHMDALILQSSIGEIETGDLAEFRNSIWEIRNHLPAMERVSDLAGVTVDWGWRRVHKQTTEEGYQELMEVRTGTPECNSSFEEDQ